MNQVFRSMFDDFDAIFSGNKSNVLPPLSPPSALPDQAIDGSQQHKANGSSEVFNSVPFVSQNTGD